MGAVTAWTVEIEAGVSEDAPCLDGHFPDDPIVPGAILMGYAARILEEAGYELVHVKRLKFLRPLRPGRAFSVSVTPRAGGAEIAWFNDEATFARATIALRTHADA